MSAADSGMQDAGLDMREACIVRYQAVRTRTLELAGPLTVEDRQIQSMPDASPTKWHLAHTTWFFETFLLVPAGCAPFDERFGYLYNSYYDTVGAQHPRAQRGLLSRPSSEEVYAYRAHVDAGMRRLISTADEDAWPRIARLITIGLNHEEQHQELILMDIKHVFFSNPLGPAYAPAPPRPAETARGPEWVAFAGGLVEIGADGEAFAFDNETPRHKVWLEPFRLMDRLATCGEWLEFMADDGYSRPELWLSDGWAAVQREGWRAPLYWAEEEGRRWSVFTLYGWRPLEANEPVCHISYYEADAFARWRGARLPTEAEWEVAAAGCAVGFSDGLHPSSPGREPRLRQMFGETWQWSSSPYVPYPRFRPESGALGEYNGKFMSGQMVLRGSACVTPPDHSRPSYRNFFPPAARWPFSGVRLADDV
ncbi:MAG TPA: ergothioneine biosynthesis protein EgtB [Caulobacteraceae bacterium]|nr:ergothioneine biosynthesis protein EgtB [Caulobacteraceae bacterium]